MVMGFDAIGTAIRHARPETQPSPKTIINLN
jgi:hypothetical protein